MPDTLPAREQRLAPRLIRYWEEIRAGDILPAIIRFDKENPDLSWKNCFQVAVTHTDDKPVYTYEDIGSEIKGAYGADLTGQKLTSSIRKVPGAQILAKIDEIYEKNEPILEQAQFINENDAIVKYRSCILPFGTKKGKITHAIVGLTWRLY